MRKVESGDWENVVTRAGEAGPGEIAVVVYLALLRYISLACSQGN